MSKSKKNEDRFVKKPIYPGGLTAMRKLIAAEMKYPAAAIQEKVEGSVYVRYGIDYKGHVSEVKVLQGLGHGCDEEAIRLVKLFKFQVPKLPRKVKVGFHKKLRIHFKLPKQKKPSKTTAKQKAKTARNSANQTFRYSVIPNNTKQKAPTEKKSGYSYTITY